MKYEDTIEIRAVTVMRQTDGALFCRMGNQQRWIAPTQLQPGSTVAGAGDVGTVVLKRPFAVEHGLVPFQGLHGGGAVVPYSGWGAPARGPERAAARSSSPSRSP